MFSRNIILLTWIFLSINNRTDLSQEGESAVIWFLNPSGTFNNFTQVFTLPVSIISRPIDQIFITPSSPVNLNWLTPSCELAVVGYVIQHTLSLKISIVERLTQFTREILPGVLIALLAPSNLVPNRVFLNLLLKSFLQNH